MVLKQASVDQGVATQVDEAAHHGSSREPKGRTTTVRLQLVGCSPDN